MAENLNEYFSSVFTREDIILPVLETKFEGRESDYLGFICNPNYGGYEHKRYEG